MSWARFGSPCQYGLPPHPANDVCPVETCPGSDVYVYERDDTELVCCMCSLSVDQEGDFIGNEHQMIRHLNRHKEAGHHVRPSLIADHNK